MLLLFVVVGIADCSVYVWCVYICIHMSFYAQLGSPHSNVSTHLPHIRLTVGARRRSETLAERQRRRRDAGIWNHNFWEIVFWFIYNVATTCMQAVYVTCYMQQAAGTFAIAVQTRAHICTNIVHTYMYVCIKKHCGKSGRQQRGASNWFLDYCKLNWKFWKSKFWLNEKWEICKCVACGN